ncbi:hypothetical protein HN51_054376 [Arachis hypogaea]
MPLVLPHKIKDNRNSQTKDVSINLARSLYKAGNAVDAIQECENLRKEGMLDFEIFQVYAISLWQLGKNDLALSIVRSLAASVSSMEKTAIKISISFIFRLLYYISGLDAVITNIMKMPKELIQSSKVNFVMSVVDALDGHNRLGFLVSSNLYFLKDHDEIARVHFLIALGKLVKNGHDGFLAVQSGIAYLRRILHIFPNCSLIRNLVGYLSLSGKESNSCHLAIRCCKLDHLDLSDKEGLKSASDIHGIAVVACYANGNSNPKSTFQTCTNQCSRAPAVLVIGATNILDILDLALLRKGRFDKIILVRYLGKADANLSPLEYIILFEQLGYKVRLLRGTPLALTLQ